MNNKHNLISKFWDHDRQRDDLYNFSELGLDDEISKDLCGAFTALTGHYAVTSRRQAWRSIRKFAEFLKNSKTSKPSQRYVIRDFYNYLEASDALLKTNQSHLNFVKRVVSYLSGETESVTWRSQILTNHSFPRESENIRDNEIDATLLSRIREAAKAEIKLAINDFSVRKKILEGGEISGVGLSEKDINSIQTLISYESSGVWTQKQVIEAGDWQATRAGLRRCARYRELTMATALPFYLFLIIETAGNPHGIKDINVKCIEEHLTNPELIYLNWWKGRGHIEQSLPLLRRGRFSVEALVGHLVEMTSSIRHLARPGDKEKLFITRDGPRSKRISVQSYHNELAEFRHRHDLPYFTFSDLRDSVSNLLGKTGYSKKKIGKFLHHKDEKTTNIYTKGREFTEKRYQKINEFQGEMIKKAKAMSDKKEPKKFESAMGFLCKNHLQGIAQGSKNGEPCLQYLQCATCPNAVVVVDDYRYVSRIVKAEEVLSRYKAECAYSADKIIRFAEVFQPILTIINRDILAVVDKNTLSKATEFAKGLPTIPVIE